MDDIIAASVTGNGAKVLSVKEKILALARAHGVSFQPTPLDHLADSITRLAGDDVQLDEPALLLLALRRGGYLTGGEFTRLHSEYLRAKYE